MTICSEQYNHSVFILSLATNVFVVKERCAFTAEKMVKRLSYVSTRRNRNIVKYTDTYSFTSETFYLMQMVFLYQK